MEMLPMNLSRLSLNYFFLHSFFYYFILFLFFLTFYTPLLSNEFYLFTGLGSKVLLFIGLNKSSSC